MVSLSTGFQGITASQAELVQHWYSCSVDDQLPQRESLDPGAIRSHLACISIVEIEANGGVRFRLAGSGLRQVLGREMRGRLISELDQTLSEIWSLGLSSAREKMRPVGGVIERENDAHAWLRMPLYSPRISTLIMCHDTLVPKSRLRDRDGRESHRDNQRHNILAA